MNYFRLIFQMNGKTKITLSDKELSLVTDADWILTKQQIIEKVYCLFGEMVPVIKISLLDRCPSLPAAVLQSVPKISRGEQYLQLPYVMLDYPRQFDKENIFAVRTMFWWANFFSITLHVSGKYLDEVREKLLKQKALLETDFFIGVNEDQWEHHFETKNYVLFSQLNDDIKLQLLNSNSFLKLALKYNLDQWNDIPSLLHEGYKKIGEILS